MAGMAGKPQQRSRGKGRDMTNKPLSDKEIIAQEERSRRAVFAMLAGFFVCVAIAILLLLASGVHLISMWLVNVLGAALLFGWVLFAFMRTKQWTPPPAEVFGEEYLRKTIDLQHRRWRFQIITLLLGLCWVAGTLTFGILEAHLEGFYLSLFSLTFAFVALIAVLTVSYGPGFFFPSYRRALNDELTRAQHAKVAQFGYILAVIEMCAVLAAAAYKPLWGIAALPFAVTAAIVLPGIYFLILQWRAGRSD
jgi:hypothetical protein